MANATYKVMTLKQTLKPDTLLNKHHLMWRANTAKQLNSSQSKPNPVKAKSTQNKAKRTWLSELAIIMRLNHLIFM